MKSSLGSILSCLARKRMQHFYALSSFHYYANGIYLVTCFQQAFASSECVPPKVSKSQPLKPRELTARHRMETRVPQKGKCIVGKRIRNMCSILPGLFLSDRSASEVTWEPQNKNTTCSGQPPTPIIPSALPKQVTGTSETGKAAAFQGDHSTEMFPH